MIHFRHGSKLSASHGSGHASRVTGTYGVFSEKDSRVRYAALVLHSTLPGTRDESIAAQDGVSLKFEKADHTARIPKIAGSNIQDR